MRDHQVPAADPVLESHTHQDARRSEPEGEERRERRSRDRYGRDRRERQPRDETAVPANDAVNAEVKEAAPEERTDRPRYPTGFVTEEAHATPQPPQVQAPLIAPQAAPEAPRPTGAPAQAPAPAPAAKGLPKVQTFELPVSELAQVAEGSGLQWVNSDAQKIAAVQAQIAAEPRPPRVPRERPAAIVVDEGPLVLVETKRDLQGMKLPFEQGSLPLQ
jgi:ribonuclease E